MATVLVIEKTAPILQLKSADKVCDELHIALMNSTGNVATIIQQDKYKGVKNLSVFTFINELKRGGISTETHEIYEFRSDDAGFWVKGTEYICKAPSYINPQYAHAFN